MTITDDWLAHPVLAAIDTYADELSAEEAASDDARRLSDRTVEILREIGVMKILQPASWGGFEADPRVFNEACRRLGQIAPVAGWVLGVIGVHHWNMALYDHDAQAAVWGEDPETWVSASYGPAGRAVPVEGGFELTGRWGFSSGSDHCRWAFVGGMSEEDGQMVYRHYLVERDVEYRVEDVWHAAGLAGSGSNDLVVEKAFVPANRALDASLLVHMDVPGRETQPAPLYRIPWYTLFLNSIVTAMIGMSQQLVAATREIHAQRAAQGKLPEHATLVRLAEADAWSDLGYVALQRNLTEVWERIRSGETLSMELRQRAKRDHISAVKLAVQAGNEAYAIAGPRAILRGASLEKYWRDLNAGAHHAMNLPEASWGQYGRYLVDGTPVGLI